MLKRFIVAVFLLLFASIVFAEPGFDDLGNPNDPNVNERANACFEGATMENRCHNEFEWQVGWYLIRLEFGIFSREDIPVWLRPAEIKPDEIAPTGIPPTGIAPTEIPPSTCAFAWSPNYYVDFSTSNFVGSGNYWSDANCTSPNGNLSRKWVFSPSGQSNATSICITNLGAGYVAIASHGPLVFECVV